MTARSIGVRSIAMAGEPVPRDRSSARRANLSLILRLLRDQGPRSRARIGADIGLPKATVSSLIGELLDAGLVLEREPERDGGIGRPSQSVEIDGHTAHGIGIEVNVDYLGLLVHNLRGETAVDRRVALDVRAMGPGAVLDAVAGLITEGVDAVRERGGQAVGVGLAVPGTVDIVEGTIRYASTIGWTDVPVIPELRTRLGAGTEIHLENDAKLAALAEYVAASRAGVRDLVYITGQIGVGVGIVTGGQLLRGIGGYAGEIGHLPLVPSDRPCTCGRRGCWETLVGREALLRLAADPDDVVRDPLVDLDVRLGKVLDRARAGDVRTLTALDTVATDLVPGLTLLVDMLNPRWIVLGGHFAFFGPLLIDKVRTLVHDRVLAPDLGGGSIELSQLGFSAAARGAALLALDAVYLDPIQAMTLLRR